MDSVYRPQPDPLASKRLATAGWHGSNIRLWVSKTAIFDMMSSPCGGNVSLDNVRNACHAARLPHSVSPQMGLIYLLLRRCLRLAYVSEGVITFLT